MLPSMGEGPLLDFKRQQHPFKRDTTEVKSELLKYASAIVNAHRHSTAVFSCFPFESADLSVEVFRMPIQRRP